jgi:hypothetical protein
MLMSKQGILFPFGNTNARLVLRHHREMSCNQAVQRNAKLPACSPQVMTTYPLHQPRWTSKKTTDSCLGQT